MSNHETMKEYCNLVVDFTDSNPFFDRGKTLDTMAREMFSFLYQCESCLDVMAEMSNRANFVQIALLMEMERDNFPLEENTTDVFENTWNVALITTAQHFATKARKNENFRDADEFKDVFLKNADSAIRRFLNRRQASNNTDMNIWLNKVYTAYENRMIFG